MHRNLIENESDMCRNLIESGSDMYQNLMETRHCNSFSTVQNGRYVKRASPLDITDESLASSLVPVQWSSLAPPACKFRSRKRKIEHVGTWRKMQIRNQHKLQHRTCCFSKKMAAEIRNQGHQFKNHFTFTHTHTLTHTHTHTHTRGYVGDVEVPWASTFMKMLHLMNTLSPAHSSAVHASDLKIPWVSGKCPTALNFSWYYSIMKGSFRIWVTQWPWIEKVSTDGLKLKVWSNFDTGNIIL